MKYEQKNNIGIGLMLVGTLLIGGSFFLPTTFLVLGMIAGVAMVGAGFYLMTRGFEDVDKDHPDYNRYQELKRQSEKHRKQ